MRLILSLLFFAAFLSGCGGDTEAGRTLRVTAISDEDPTALLRKNKPMVDYLKEALGVEVTFTPVANYAGAVAALESGNADLAWLGGYTSVQSVRGKGERLVRRVEDAKFRSVFVARADAGIKTLADLKQKSFSFGSESSTSGHLMPRHFLAQNGINPEKDFKGISFSDAHPATAKAVEGGSVDAGALNFKVWDQMVAEKKIDTSKVVEFWRTPEYTDYCWVMHESLDAGLKKKLRDAFLALDPQNPEQKKVLDLQRASRYVVARDEEWAGIVSAAKAAGMLKD